jgi:anti-sigma B factor antagonist
MSTQVGTMPDGCPVQWTGRLAILALPQHVGDCNADQIREQLLWVINCGAAELIIDMTGTASCHHEGAAAVARAHQRATASGTQLRLAVTTGAVQRVLCLNGLDRLIPVYPSLDAAIVAATPAATGYAESSAEGTALGGGQVSTAALPGPLRTFTAQLDELRSGDVPDMDRVGRHLAELAADTEFSAPLIAEIPSEPPGDRWLIRPERGPRLVLVHRPEGVMGYTHSHRCWVGIAPVRGVETHQRWDAVRHRDGRAGLRLADERALRRGDVATLVPPRDVHNHGHVAGTGPSPYSLIMLGDDMLLFDREEYDPDRGTWRALPPGDPGRLNR